jgi:ketosteroid isomerase-like protein
MSASEVETNRAVVRKFLERVEAFDLAGIGECLDENVVQHYPAPSHPTDDGRNDRSSKSGRQAILDEIGENFHARLYRRGTVKIEIQHIIAEGPYVACRFTLAARTVTSDRPYKNSYNFFYRCEGGKVAEYWEYVDTKLAPTCWGCEGRRYSAAAASGLEPMSRSGMKAFRRGSTLSANRRWLRLASATSMPA